MIVVFGASGGVGNALFTHFKMLGKNCIGTYNSNRISSSAGMVRLDITDELAVSDFIKELNISEPLYVINCVGVTDKCPIHKADLESWKSVVDINLIGAFNIARAVLPYMRESGFGRMVNFGSIVSQRPVFGSSAYIVSKAALVGFSKAINVENANRGISAVTINLGYSDVGMIESVPSKIKNDIISGSPYGRLCSMSEVISTVKYIFDCEYLGGGTIDLFGGA